ncbi:MULTISPECIES: hypothetical protein [unclassified Streptomyces]|uniref:hypothetical protein n=1 Tax=unclassified Streptomyces TaxID=2593676 RepID=UPI00226F460D|nr:MULTISPECIES: hypothetical protein [unclassified Streptomyces]MCY0923364.1 hypothetical protein [Streptomyces sp. H27-G5]MCY0962223.1 hypothetical protein [Streptomyces sp. H27-H5]
MSNRRIRRALLVPAMAGSLLAAPAAFAWGQAAAAPTATCSISGVFPNGKVHLSGGGFTPGSAFLSSPTAAGGSFTIGGDGGFQMMNVENAKYTVSQGNDRTECSGFKESTEKQDDTTQNDQNQNDQNQNQNHQNRNNRNQQNQNE